MASSADPGLEPILSDGSGPHSAARAVSLKRPLLLQPLQNASGADIVLSQSNVARVLTNWIYCPLGSRFRLRNPPHCHMIRTPNGKTRESETARPLAPVFKWPGGKRSLISSIEPFLDRPYRRLVEPFCGGAALFFYLRPRAALLADRNVDLINAYVQIRDNVEDVIDRLKDMQNTEAAYYEARTRRPRTALTRAIRFIYLMQLSFNGIYRENLRGDFNVPYGYKTWLTVCDEERLRAASLALQGTECEAQTYGETMESLRETDLVYVDPPYTVSHNNNGFIKYNRTLFSWNDQKDLATACEQARRKGSAVIVSNADHHEIRALYPEFDYHQLNRFCPISGSAGGRKHVTEALFVGRPT